MNGPLVVDGMEVWDNTKLSAYMDCEMKGKLGFEEHLIPQEPAEGLAFGAAFHKAVEVWTLTQDTGKGQAAFVKVWEEMLPRELREKNEFEGNRRSIQNFVRLFGGFTQKFPLDMWARVLAVEVPFTVRLGTTPEGVPIAWSGVIDRVVEWQEKPYVVDIKTSTYALDDRFFEKFRLAGQFMGYLFAASQLGYGEIDALNGVIVQGIQVQAPLKTKIKPATDLIQCEVVPYDPEQIQEWREDVLVKIDDIYRARARGKYVMSRGNACNIYNGCEFARVCSATPGLREQRKQQHYRERVWNPLERIEI